MPVFQAKQGPAAQPTTARPVPAHAKAPGSAGHDIASLLQALGNQATQRLLRQYSGAGETAGQGAWLNPPQVWQTRPAGIQPKLKINAPGDLYEREADRISEQVMSMPEARPASAPLSRVTAGLQRQCSCGGTCADCQAEEHASDHSNTVQRKPAAPASAGVASAPPIVHEVLRSPGQPLDATTRAFMEPRFGQDFSGVRVHTDNQAAESAVALRANAYTLGHHVVFREGAFNPSSGEGRRLIAHELAHTVQQRGGGTEPSGHAPSREGEANRAGSQVLSGSAVAPLTRSGLALARDPASDAAIDAEILQIQLQLQMPVHPLRPRLEARLAQLQARRARGAPDPEAEDLRQAREAARQEYIERGQRLVYKDATLILPEDFGKYQPTDRRTIYPEIRPGNASGDIEIIGVDGGLVIFRRLTFYYEMGVDAFHRNIGAAGMVASGVWENSKGVLYAGALAAKKAGQIGRLLPVPPAVNVGFRVLERAGTEGLEELDRMEAVRLGYEPHEKTELEKMEEGLDYLDPSGLQPAFKIPKSPKTGRVSEPEPGGRSLHEEGGSKATGHGDKGRDRPVAKTGPEAVKENVVHEAARQDGTIVIIDGRKHGIAAFGNWKKANLEFCGPCAPVAGKLQRLLDVLPGNYNPTIKKDLNFLHKTASAVEKELAKGIGTDVTKGMTPDSARQVSRTISRQLNAYIRQDSRLGRILEMSPAEFDANRARLTTELSASSPATPTPKRQKPELTRVKADPVTARPKGTPSVRDVDVLAQPGTRRQGRAYPSVHKHHIFPQELKAWFKERFAGVKEDIHDYTVYVSEGEHSALHATGKGGRVKGVQEPDLKGWNKEWKDFRDAHHDASAQAIFEEAGRLMGKYKISEAKIDSYRRSKK